MFLLKSAAYCCRRDISLTFMIGLLGQTNNLRWENSSEPSTTYNYISLENVNLHDIGGGSETWYMDDKNDFTFNKNNEYRRCLCERLATDTEMENAGKLH